jgi:hypothetical protein
MGGPTASQPKPAFVDLGYWQRECFRDLLPQTPRRHTRSAGQHHQQTAILINQAGVRLSNRPQRMVTVCSHWLTPPTRSSPHVEFSPSLFLPHPSRRLRQQESGDRFTAQSPFSPSRVLLALLNLLSAKATSSCLYPASANLCLDKTQPTDSIVNTQRARKQVVSLFIDSQTRASSSLLAGKYY